MAGYSSTPLPQKLGIKPAHVVALFGAPPGFERLLAPLPPGVTIRAGARGKYDVGLLFVETVAELGGRLPGAVSRLDSAGGLWIAWRKGKVSEVSENRVRELGLETGLVDNKVCAIDETWSGLRFVHRLSNRPKATKPARSATRRPRAR
jgi:hypothetical protein